VALVQLAIEQPDALMGVTPEDALAAAVEMAEIVFEKGHFRAAGSLCADFLRVSRGRLPDSDPARQRLMAIGELLRIETETAEVEP
jgi:hypothetical protein